MNTGPWRPASSGYGGPLPGAGAGRSSCEKAGRGGTHFRPVCGCGPLASPEPFPLPLLVQRGSHVRVEPGWGHAWVGGLLPFSTGQKVRSKRASWTSPSVQNRKHLKLGKTHILSVCQTLFMCVCPSTGKDKKGVST